MVAKVFGDPSGFAIRCVSSEESTLGLAYYCHWLLNNNLIGAAQELCYLPTWTAALLNFKHSQLPKIIASSFIVDAAAIHNIFATPHEVWDEETLAVWETHRITLDETQDAWQLLAYSEHESIVFAGQGWRTPCPVQDIGRIFTATSGYSSIIEAIDACLRYVGSDQ